MEALLLALAVALSAPDQGQIAAYRANWPGEPWFDSRQYAGLEPAAATHAGTANRRKTAVARRHSAAVANVRALRLNVTGMERSGAECRDKWDLADPHGYGIIFGRDLSAARTIMPATLANRDYVTIEEYLSACSDIVAANRNG
jgi:hypothetical protein